MSCDERPRCTGCNGEAHAGGKGYYNDECVCAHGSCETCGAPYGSEFQQTQLACGQCFDVAAEKAMEAAANSPTQELPAITDFQLEALRRMGVTS